MFIRLWFSSSENQSEEDCFSSFVLQELKKNRLWDSYTVKDWSWSSATHILQFITGLMWGCSHDLVFFWPILIPRVFDNISASTKWWRQTDTDWMDTWRRVKRDIKTTFCDTLKGRCLSRAACFEFNMSTCYTVTKVPSCWGMVTQYYQTKINLAMSIFDTSRQEEGAVGWSTTCMTFPQKTEVLVILPLDSLI